MQANPSVVHIKPFTRIRLNGRIDLDTGRRVISDLIFSDKTPQRVLIDLRFVDWNHLTDGELMTLIEEAWTIRGAGGKRIAILDHEARHRGRGEMFDRVARNRGIRVTTFFSYEDAVEGLQFM